MAGNRLHKIFSRLVEIKPGEEKISLLLFSYFFLATASYSIIKSLRVASYLDTLGANKLPLAYLLTAVFTGFTVALHSKLQVRTPRQVLIVSSLGFFILTAVLFWFFFPHGWSWLPLAYWIWANIFVVVLITQFWISVNDVFNPREAKRLIGFFGSGGILGGIVGGEITGLLAKSNVDFSLLLIAAGFLIVCAFVVHFVFIWQRKSQTAIEARDKKTEVKREEGARVGFKDCFDTVRKDSYLKLLAAAVTLTLVVSTFIDWQFNSVVQNAASLKNNLTAFFGHFNAGLLVFSFFLQILVTSRLIQRYGVRFSLLLYPLILLLCSMGIAVFPLSLYFAILIKGSDKSLSYSLNQSVRELLYIPISPEIKYKAKIFIDMFLNRFAKGIGALILMLLISLGLGIRFVSLSSALFIFGWIVLNLKVTGEYTKTVKQKLKMKWERADRLVARILDVDYTKLVFDTLDSKNRSSVLYAMHFFDLIKQDKLTPEVKKLISYKSDEIRASSLGTFFDEEAALLPEIDDSLGDEALKKEVAEIMSLDVYQEVMKSYVEKTLTDQSAEAEIAKMEVAKAIGLMEARSSLVEKLEELLQDESVEVSRLAVESAGKLRHREHVLFLIRKLENPFLREEAASALEKYGSRVVGTLSDYLADSAENLELRKAAASVLARIATQEAADFLIWELQEAKEDILTELNDALDEIRSSRPETKFREEIVRTQISAHIEKYCRSLVRFDEPKAEREKSKEWEKKLEISLMNVFKFLGLIYPHEDIMKAYQNIKTGTKESVAYALELLDNTLKKDVKEILLPIIEDLPFEERVNRCRSLLKTLSNF